MKSITKKIIENKIKNLLALVKEAKQINFIEREMALLAVDIVLMLKKEKVEKFSCDCFKKIDFAITGTLRKNLSEEARDLLNEMIILDELGKDYGPDLNLIVDLARKLLEKQNDSLIAEAKRAVSATAV